MWGRTRKECGLMITLPGGCHNQFFPTKVSGGLGWDRYICREVPRSESFNTSGAGLRFGEILVI